MLFLWLTSYKMFDTHVSSNPQNYLKVIIILFTWG